MKMAIFLWNDIHKPIGTFPFEAAVRKWKSGVTHRFPIAILLCFGELCLIEKIEKNNALLGITLALCGN